MQPLNQVIADLQQQYPNVSNGRFQQAIQMIQKDQEVQQFFADHQDQLQPDALTVGMMDLFEFVVQKKKMATNQPILYPGYHPTLGLEKGYPHVSYEADPATRAKEQRDRLLKKVALPKSVAQANLKQIQQETLANGDKGRAQPVAESINLLRALQAKQAGKQEAYVPGLYLAGDFGIGKTYLMGALANALVASGIEVLMVHWPSFLDQLKASFNKKDQSTETLIDQAKQAQVLIIDDIGADTLSAWSRDAVLAVILEYRMQNELTTCFTSNLGLPGLETYLAESKEMTEKNKAKRLMQRVLFLSKEVYMTGENRRLQR
ncbi:primosomal protein DnaI [Leuconostocaceae bacterium ESL0958]|nr:primosomal protein DnaI [Leuconostocaceae bacterium ESL0958]